MEVCVWEKMKGKYKTTCGHNPANIGRGWTYCPFCSGLLTVSKVFYQKKYHEAHKADKQQYYKKYYEEHK